MKISGAESNSGKGGSTGVGQAARQRVGGLPGDGLQPRQVGAGAGPAWSPDVGCATSTLRRGYSSTKRGTANRLAGGGQAKPDYAEVIPVNEGGRTTQLEAGAAFLPIKDVAGMECQQQAGGAEK